MRTGEEVGETSVGHGVKDVQRGVRGCGADPLGAWREDREVGCEEEILSI